MSFNKTLWRPDSDTRAQIRHGQKVCRTATTSESEAYAKGRADRIKRAAERDRNEIAKD
jgi:hypothetical protein